MRKGLCRDNQPEWVLRRVDLDAFLGISRIFHRMGFRDPMELSKGLSEGTVGCMCSQLSSNICIW